MIESVCVWNVTKLLFENALSSCVRGFSYGILASKDEPLQLSNDEDKLGNGKGLTGQTKVCGD